MNKRMKKKQPKNETRAVDVGLCNLLLLTKKKGLDFSVSTKIGGVYIYNPETSKTISYGYIKDWSHATPIQEVSRMIKEVVEY